MSNEEVSFHELLKNSTFLETDTCILSIEVCHDTVYFANPDYLKKSLKESGFTEMILEMLMQEPHTSLPIWEIFKNIQGFDKNSKIKNDFNLLKRVPGFEFYEIKHDDKRSTVFFGFKLASNIEKVKKINTDILQRWSIEVKTAVGSFVIN